MQAYFSTAGTVLSLVGVMLVATLGLYFDGHSVFIQSDAVLGSLILASCFSIINYGCKNVYESLKLAPLVLIGFNKRLNDKLVDTLNGIGSLVIKTHILWCAYFLVVALNGNDIFLKEIISTIVSAMIFPLAFKVFFVDIVISKNKF